MPGGIRRIRMSEIASIKALNLEVNHIGTLIQVPLRRSFLGRPVGKNLTRRYRLTRLLRDCRTGETYVRVVEQVRLSAFICRTS